MSAARFLDVRRPDDFHVHLRQGAELGAYVREAARVFARALVMPNTLPPITTPAALLEYRDRILAATATGAATPQPPAAPLRPTGARLNPPAVRSQRSPAPPDFTPLMTFKIQRDLEPEQVAQLAAAGAVAGKYYPRGVTTNSEDGIDELDAVDDLLAAMEERDLVLCIHGEQPGVPILERERAFLPRLEAVAHRFKRLRIVLEHVSSRPGIEAVLALPERVAATITVHHLLYTIDDLLGDRLQPHLYCKPIVKSADDRDAVTRAALSANPRFFFGSDSAPHPRSAKECGSAAAGVYSMPTSLPLLAALFERYDALRLLEDFTSRFGAQFYGLPLNGGRLELRRERWRVPEIVDGVVPLGAGTELEWQVEPRANDEH